MAMKVADLFALTHSFRRNQGAGDGPRSAAVPALTPTWNPAAVGKIDPSLVGDGATYLRPPTAALAPPASAARPLSLLRAPQVEGGAQIARPTITSPLTAPQLPPATRPRYVGFSDSAAPPVDVTSAALRPPTDNINAPSGSYQRPALQPLYQPPALDYDPIRHVAGQAMGVNEQTRGRIVDPTQFSVNRLRQMELEPPKHVGRLAGMWKAYGAARERGRRQPVVKAR